MQEEKFPALGLEEPQLVSTRCPAVDDDAPQFMADVPFTRVGDVLPSAVCCDVFDSASVPFGRIDAAVCAGKLTVVCAFDPSCCICKRFALPRLEQLWLRLGGNQHCMIVAIGRGCDAAGLHRFREECCMAASEGDRHIVALTMPMAPDAHGAIFRSLAEAIVPRFYLVGPDHSILYQCAGFEDSEFRFLEDCLEQELLYV
eukprot:NODE_20595_length_791_cov_3.012048.p1 GENE.NODE_20595_length_791_cov_3.012048~~NODE_20595_length_791_cov_3.012048.p1  ORF type:complete len:201 (-),score=44.84 NODE_20595_length_791_cov_3.012048:62-664(-)